MLETSGVKSRANKSQRRVANHRRGKLGLIMSVVLKDSICLLRQFGASRHRNFHPWTSKETFVTIELEHKSESQLGSSAKTVGSWESMTERTGLFNTYTEQMRISLRPQSEIFKRPTLHICSQTPASFKDTNRQPLGDARSMILIF